MIAGAGGAAYFLLLRNKPAPATEEQEAGTGGKAGAADEAGGAARDGDKAQPDKPKEDAAKKPSASNALPTGPIFVSIPTVVVNIKDSAKPRYLRLTLAIEVADSQGEGAAKSQIPKIVDAVQLFLRTQQTDAFVSVSSLIAVRSEILHRINGLDKAIRARAVLIQELMIQ